MGFTPLKGLVMATRSGTVDPGGLDVLSFTGGVGEHAPAVRSRAAPKLAFLGVELDERRNARAAGDAEIGTQGGKVSVLVVTAREDLEIASQVRRLLTTTHDKNS